MCTGMTGRHVCRVLQFDVVPAFTVGSIGAVATSISRGGNRSACAGCSSW